MAYPPSEMISAETLRDILENPEQYTWRSHGIGMLRTYLDPGFDDWRLNLWHSRLLNPGISTMHTHPWAFQSFVIAGALANTRWMRVSEYAEFPAACYNEGIIPCGAHAPRQHTDGPLLEGEPVKVWLQPLPGECWQHGDQYRQAPEEIHTTQARDGTISVMHRTDYTEDGRASVFWPCGAPWGDASRPTSEEDVLVTVAAALEALNKTPWSIV